MIATTRRAAWQESPRGLGPADLAMHVVLPELDGRILSGAIAFKDALPSDDALAFTAFASRPEPDRIAIVADRIAALARLQRTPRSERRIAVLMPDYPGAAGRTAYAVGLDVPASIVALIADLADAGYRVTGAAAKFAGAARGGRGGHRRSHGFRCTTIAACSASFRPKSRPASKRHGAMPEADPDVSDGAFRFRAAQFGNVLVALPPDRGRIADRRAAYHDPTLPPRHALLAFGLWLRHVAKADAIVHMGAHGTLEWLPGKAVALTASCFPEAVVGPLPVFYPFLVSNPGEAAQAKRRIAAVTIGHLPPPLVNTELGGPAQELERLVDEYAIADGLDRRRRERLARLIIETAQRTGLAREAGVAAELNPDEALRKIDAWLCDLKDLAIKDGLHVFGRMPEGEIADPLWQASADGGARRSADGARRQAREGGPGRRAAARPARRAAHGPQSVHRRSAPAADADGHGAWQARGRRCDPPLSPDPWRDAARARHRSLGQRHAQDRRRGDRPRSRADGLPSDLGQRAAGASPASRFCRRAAMGRPRVDVTWRISGLFRDLFPAQIALIDAAVRLVAQRDEDDDENPLAAAARLTRGDGASARPHLRHGARRLWRGRRGAARPGQRPRRRSAPPISPPRRMAMAARRERARRCPAASPRASPRPIFCCTAATILRAICSKAPRTWRMSAASPRLPPRSDARPIWSMLDTTDPNRPRARTLDAALARIVRGRAVNPRFIEGQMRHGARGAAELAETVDRLVDFAETTGAVSSALFDLVHDAYLADPRVREFLMRENPEAARVIAERLEAARRKGLWHPRRNDLGEGLTGIQAEAAL